MVRATGNIFFDVSDVNFTVTTFAITPQIVFDSFTVSAEDCPPANGSIDPGELVTANISLRNIGSGPATNLVAALAASSGVIPLSGVQNYGLLDPMGAAVSRPFTFLAAGVCGGSVTGLFRLTNGPTALASVTNTFLLGAPGPATNSFASVGAITIPNSGAASPYGSTITVAGLSGPITKLTVTLTNITHSHPDDLDVLLVGPGGQAVILMSDVGAGPNLSSATLAFDDAAASPLPDESAITAGTWRPTNVGVDEVFPAPAPAQPYGTNLSAFNGTIPAGVWSLYVFDDASSSGGSMGGWHLKIISQSSLTCCSNAVLPLLTLDDTSVIEGNTGRTDAKFPLRLSRPFAQTVLVNYATANGTALAGVGYAPTNGTAQFPPGQTNQTLRVGVMGDVLMEGNETFSLTLSAPMNATLARAAATGTILDDEVLLSATTVSNVHALLQFNTMTGVTYRVESSDYLPNTNTWDIVPGAALLNGTGGALQITDTNALAQPQRFYRVLHLD
jgi:subtilisin-like proprotein convertase family protein